jgi:hypothetical protein
MATGQKSFGKERPVEINRVPTAVLSGGRTWQKKRLGEGVAEVGDDMEKSTEGQEAESELVEDSVLENQIRLDPLDTTFAEGGEKAVVVEGRCEVRVRFLFAKCCPAVSIIKAAD